MYEILILLKCYHDLINLGLSKIIFKYFFIIIFSQVHYLFIHTNF